MFFVSIFISGLSGFSSFKGFSVDFSGRFLVTKIRHVISLNKGNAEYKMVIEMRKDGLEKPAPDVGHLKALKETAGTRR